MGLFDYGPRLIIAMLLGALIGLERQFSRQMAGIRTNALVSLGACLFCLISFQSGGQGDTFRIAAAVVTGIGFLGGGVIVRDGFTIKGLTTAATLWCTSAVGVAVAIGYYGEGIIATGLILLINLAMRPFSRMVRLRAEARPLRAFQYHVVVACEKASAGHLRAELAQIAEKSRMLLKSMDDLPGTDEETHRLTLLLQSDHDDSREVERVIAMALSLQGVVSAAWEAVDEHDS